MPKIETKTFDKDHKPIERDIIKYCSKCGKSMSDNHICKKG